MVATPTVPELHHTATVTITDAEIDASMDAQFGGGASF